MKKILQFISLIAIMALSASSIYSQDLVYKPKNPYFGGDTFNYQWLLSSATTQDLIEDTRPDPFDTGSTIDDFAESLNRQLLSQISRQLVTAQFGENGLEEGNYTIGDFQIDVTSTLDGLLITIVDNAAGDLTEIIIPFY